MRKITAFIIAAVLTSVFLQPKTANAVTTISDFSFTGTCTTDCTRTVTATLVLQNYTIGSAFDSTNFVSFTYHSNLFDISVPSNNPFSSANGTFGSLPGFDFVSVFFQVGGQLARFESGTDGSWCVGPGCFSDQGTNGVWAVAPVPLPAALPLFATGLGALGLLGWRRKRKAQAAA
jgi:hypothetical protein